MKTKFSNTYFMQLLKFVTLIQFRFSYCKSLTLRCTFCYLKSSTTENKQVNWTPSLVSRMYPVLNRINYLLSYVGNVYFIQVKPQASFGGLDKFILLLTLFHQIFKFQRRFIQSTYKNRNFRMFLTKLLYCLRQL